MSSSFKEYYISYGPHIRKGRTTKQIMFMVCLALCPALIWSFFIFGYKVFLITISAILGSLLGEYLICKLIKKESTVKDGSALCTGMLLAFTLPPGISIHLPFIGAFIAIILTKGVFGGLGHNIFNVALIGRAIMMAAFPVEMTTKWLEPKLLQLIPSGTTMATPLAVIKHEGSEQIISYFQNFSNEIKNIVLRLFIGIRPGCIGEVSIFLLLLGAFFIWKKGIIRLYIPFSVLLGAALIGVFHDDFIIYMLSGGLWLGAFFMATDYVTSPTTPKAQIIFGLGIGILTGIIRLWGGYPEGVCYAILLMNTMTPALDTWFPPKRISVMGAPS